MARKIRKRKLNARIPKVRTGKHGGKRNSLQRTEDKVIIKNLYLRGLNTREIAKHISEERPYTLSYVTIADDILEIKAEMEANLSMEVKGHMAKMIATIDLQEAELWAAWDRSRKVQTKTITEQAGKKAKVISVKTTTQARDGNRGFMTEVSRLHAQRRAILGLDQPKRQILQDEKGQPLEFVIRLAESELP